MKIGETVRRSRWYHEKTGTEWEACPTGTVVSVGGPWGVCVKWESNTSWHPVEDLEAATPSDRESDKIATLDDSRARLLAFCHPTS